MSSDARAVVKYNDAISDVTGGSADVNDFVFQYWYKSNFGDLLQPAPMAVAVLGNLSIVASTTDFKLVAPKDGFKQVSYPDSFRATITQLVDTGALALQKSYSDFDEMQKRCGGVKPGVNNIVSLLSGERAASEQEMNSDIQRYLPSQISQLQNAVGVCLAKAQETDALFHDLLTLTMEIHESCTATQGDYDAKLADAKLRETILAENKKALEENKKLAVQQQQDARQAFEDAQKQFNKAADEMPKGWDLIGMQFVEGLSTAVLGAVNAGVNKYVAQSQQSTQAQNGAINTAGGTSTGQTQGQKASVIPQNVTDPGYQKSQIIQNNALALDALTTGGPNKGVDWSKVLSTSDNSGAKWLKSSFDVALGGTWTEDAVSTQAKQLLTSGSSLSQRLADIAPNADNAAAVKPIVDDIARFVVDALKFATTASNKTGTSQSTNPGFAVPQNPPNLDSGSATQMAVKTAQYKLEATQQQLEFSRKMSQDSTDKLLAVTQALGDVLGQVARLNLEKIDWAEIRNVLLRAISFLCQLKGCLADLVHFFDAVNNLVNVTMKDACSQFITLINDATKANKAVAGITLSSWTRQTIYDQAMGAAKVAALVEKISIIYITMYDQHVQEGVKKLLLMGQWIGGDANAKGQLQKAGSELQTWARSASTGITDLIRDEQAKMSNEIEGRMQELQSAIKGILPPPPAAIKQAITESTQATTSEVTAAIDAADANKPVWKPKLGKKL